MSCVNKNRYVNEWGGVYQALKSIFPTLNISLVTCFRFCHNCLFHLLGLFTTSAFTHCSVVSQDCCPPDICMSNVGEITQNHAL